MAMGSEDADVGRPCPIGNTIKRRSRHRYSIGGELAIVDRGDDRAEQALDNKRGSQQSPKQSIDSNSYKSPRGCKCRAAASENFCPSASGLNLMGIESLWRAPPVSEGKPAGSPRIGCYLLPSRRSWEHPLLPKPLGATQTRPGHWTKSS